MDQIHNLRLGFADLWLLKGKSGWLLVDSGAPGLFGKIMGRLRKLGLGPGDIRLLVGTHPHFDHVGNTARLREACQCPVALHRAGASLTEKGRWLLPEGTHGPARAVIALARKLQPGLMAATRYPGFVPDLAVGKEMDLASHGFDARLIATPGHIPGSLTLLTKSGNAFVGDLAYNELPGIFSTRHPPFATDLGQMHRSWRMLLQLGANTIYPGHGEPFDAAQLRDSLPD